MMRISRQKTGKYLKNTLLICLYAVLALAGILGSLWLGGITSIQNSFVAATVLALVLHMVNGIISRKDVGKTAPSEAGSTAA